MFFITSTTEEVNTDVLSQLQGKFTYLKIQTKQLDKDVSSVSIKDQNYEIFYHVPDDLVDNKNPSSFINTMSTFFICLKCLFGDWTRDQLFNLLGPLPLIYNSMFTEKFQYFTYFNDVRNIISIIAQKTKIIINVLLNIYNKHLIKNDEGKIKILKTYMILNQTVDFIDAIYLTYRIPRYPLNYDGSDAVFVIQSLLQSLNAIQYSTYSNCKHSTRYENKIFYGFTMPVYSTKSFNIDTILQEIVHLDLVSKTICSTRQMLLHGVIPWSLYNVLW